VITARARDAIAVLSSALALAAMTTAATLAVRLALDGQLEGRLTLVIFALPIMLSAYVSGLRAGLMATAFAVLGVYYFVLPLHGLAVGSGADLWQLASLVLVGGVISALIEALHRARRRADAATREHHVAEQALIEAEVLQSAIFNSTSFSSIATDARGVIQIFNVGAERMLGYAAADVLNRITPADISDPQEVIARAEALSVELATPIAPGFEALAFKASRGIEDIYELTYIRKDGSRLPAMVSVTALRDIPGKIIGYLLIGTDNTARKQVDAVRRRAEASLRDSEMKLRQVIDGLGPNTFLGLMTSEGIVIEANRPGLVAAGLQFEDVLGKRFDETYWWSHSEPARVQLRAAMDLAAAGEPSRYDVQMRVVGDVLVWIDFSLNPVLDDDGRVIYLVPSGNVIDERVRAEEGRKASEERYRTLFEYAPDGIIIADADGRFIDANASACRMLGYEDDGVIGRQSSEIVAMPGTEPIGAALGAIQADGGHRREWWFRRKNGSTFAAELIATTMPDGNLMAMIHDVTERNRAESRFRRLFESNAHGVMFWNVDGKIAEANDEFLRIVGYDRADLEGGQIDWRVMTPPEYAHLDRHALAEIATTGSCTPFDKSYIRKDGALVPVTIGAANFEDDLGGGVCFVLDITQRRRVEHEAGLVKERLRSSEALLDRTGRIAGVGGWEYDLQTETLAWSAEMYRIREADPDIAPRLTDASIYYQADARTTYERAMAGALAGGTGFDLELQSLTALGREIWVRVVGVVELEDGKPSRVLGTLQDITLRKVAEQSLVQAGGLQRAIFDSANFSSIATDARGVIQIFNVGAERMLGYAAAEVMNKITPADISDPNEVIARAQTLSLELATPISPGFEALIFKASRGIEDIYELTYIRKDGSRFPAVVSVTALRDAHDAIIGYLLIGTDNTARKLAEEALLQAGALQRAIFESANFSSIATDARGVIQIFNVGAERMLGYSAAEVVNRIATDVFHDAEEDAARAAALSLSFDTPIAPGFEAMVFKASRGIQDIYEVTKVRKDGSRFPALLSVTALRDPKNAIIGYLLIATDNTATKLAADAQREHTELLRTIHLHSIVSVTDRAGRIVDVNDRFCRISGYSREELVGQTHRVVNSGVQPTEFWTDLWRHISAGKSWQGEICNRAKDGSLYWVDSIIAPCRGDSGRMEKYISIRTDITKRKHYEEGLRGATQRAELASRAKSDFLANMSHEIRTPMSAVIGLSYLLGQTELDENQSALLGKVRLASKSLLAVLNDVLDLSKIEAGELIVERAPFRLADLLAELTSVMAVQADAKGIAFETDLSVDFEQALVGDSVRLTQVLTNLLSNAIKFTERGGVKLRVRQMPGIAEHAALAFSVQDTGIGISPDEQARLFAPFAQADASITRRFGGTGLGLSIVKRLADLMGGHVTLESAPGVGSVFTVLLEFPLASPETLARLETSPALAGEYALRGVHVLVVDDSAINLDVTRRILELAGAQVWIASNGQEAFDFLEVGADSIDVVLMDVQMPILDGHDATRRIRTELKLKNLPIIALTAGALSSELQRATAAGMDDYLVKPFDTKTLVASIRRRVDARGGPPGPALTPPAVVQPPTAWPEIEGIDGRDACERLGNDFELFRSILRRMLDEFGAAAGNADDQDPVAFAARMAGRMHKLRGVAGNLGATAILKLAGEAEAAYLAGEHERGLQVVLRIDAVMLALRESAASVLLATPADDGEAATGGLEPEDLANLLGLLRQQSLTAVDRFGSLSPQLRRLLGKAPYLDVCEHIEHLRFGDAARAIEACLR
jgi:PAS domain S-box-containing protein